MKKNDKNKIIMSVVGIISLVIVVATATYAWYVWHSSANQNVNFRLTATSTITFYGGTDVEGIIKPVSSYEEGISKTIRISSTAPRKEQLSTYSSDSFNLYLDLVEFPSSLQDESFKWAIYRDSVCLDDGDFSELAEGDTITLLDNQYISFAQTSISGGIDEYVIYFWIDGENFDNDLSMGDQNIEFSLYATGDSGILDEIS